MHNVQIHVPTSSLHPSDILDVVQGRHMHTMTRQFCRPRSFLIASFDLCLYNWQPGWEIKPVPLVQQSLASLYIHG
eukprot:4380400-Ditylum_brightwellii.AAC.1